MAKKLIIVGDSSFAQIAFEYFSKINYEIACFCVDANFIKSNTLFNIPVVPFEDIEKNYPPSLFDAFIALTYGSLNRQRTRFYNEFKSKGYKLVSYISPHAFVYDNVVLGDNVFIFENNVIQPFSKVGNNTIIWSGNHIGHHTNIGSNVFISSHIVICGHANIGDSCFLGVNSTITNNVNLSMDNWIGPNCLIAKDTSPGQIFKLNDSTVASNVSAYRYFKLTQ